MVLKQKNNLFNNAFLNNGFSNLFTSPSNKTSSPLKQNKQNVQQNNNFEVLMKAAELNSHSLPQKRQFTNPLTEKETGGEKNYNFSQDCPNANKVITEFEGDLSLSGNKKFKHNSYDSDSNESNSCGGDVDLLTMEY